MVLTIIFALMGIYSYAIDPDNPVGVIIPVGGVIVSLFIALNAKSKEEEKKA